MILAAVLTLQLLASYPQTSLLTYEAIALRALWALLAARGEPPWRGVGAVAIGALLPVGLAAVKLLPGLEFSQLVDPRRRVQPDRCARRRVLPDVAAVS